MNQYAFLAIGLAVGIAVGFGIGYAIMIGPVNSLQGQVSSLQSQAALLQAQNNNLSSLNLALNENITQLQDRHDALQSNYTALSGEHTVLTGQYSVLLANYTEVQEILNMEKETVLEDGLDIAFGSLTPFSLLNYTFEYPGFLQVNYSASQFGGIFECFLFSADLSDIEDFEKFFNMTEDTFEMSGAIYMYMGTGPLSRTMMMPVLPGNNTMVLVYVGDTVESTTITFDIKYIY